MNLIIFTVFHSFTVNEDKLQNYSIWRFLLKSGYPILVKIWKWLKPLFSVPFIKKTRGDHVYIRIWSSWLTFTLLQWMKRNLNISQFSRFLLRSECAIKVKIWIWLKLLDAVTFINKKICKSTLHSNMIILTDFHRFTVKGKKFKISQFSSFLLRFRHAILVKTWKWLILLNSALFIKKTLVNQLYIRIWPFWLTFTALQWMKTGFKISQYEDFC